VTFNHGVAGSSPAALTKLINNLRPNKDQTEELRVTPRVTRVTLIRVRRAQLSGLHGFRVRSVPFSFALGRLAVARGGQIFL
jgi:hypothetical protein